MARKSVSPICDIDTSLHHHFDIDPESVDANEKLHKAVTELVAEHREQSAKFAVMQKDISRLTSYLDELEYALISIESSRAWRTGFQVVTYAKKLLGRPTGASGFHPIHLTLQRYHHWKKSRD